MQIDPAMFPHIGLGSSPVIIDLPSIPVGHMRTSVLPRFAVKGKNSTPIPAVVVWTSPWPYEVGKTPTAEDWAHEKDDVAPVFAMLVGTAQQARSISDGLLKVATMLDENGYVDNVGGYHGGGCGHNPQGVFCGECSNKTCEGCYAQHATEEVQQPDAKTDV